MEWKGVVTDLYEKISPLGGTLTYQSSMSIDSIKAMEIEFKIENFVYEDPFYGVQEAKSCFAMCIEFMCGEGYININSIEGIENQAYHFDIDDLIGAFSNSLHFSVPYCKFGEINNKHIEFEMQYILTNSDSYGMMAGDIEEHATIRGSLKTILEMKRLDF